LDRRPSLQDAAVSGGVGRPTSQFGAASTAGGMSEPISRRSSVLETPSGEEF
jgi:hypothetical protein